MANPVKPFSLEPAMTRNKPVLMAKIGAAHGLKGEVRIRSFTGDPMSVGKYGTLFDAAGNTYEIVTLRPAGNMLIARFRSVAGREQAEALNGTELFIDRAQLPEDTQRDEYYQADLIGMRLHGRDGTYYGTVEAIHNYGAGDIIEARSGTSGTVMIPFSHAAVTKVDLGSGVITVDPVAAGLVASGDENAGGHVAKGAGRQS
jgi:16S rRNA processing protein RimM